MILSGEKKEEYRDVKEHYVSRLTEFKKPFRNYTSTALAFAFAWGITGKRDRAIIYLDEKEVLKFKNFDTITFSNGYSKNRPQFVIELLHISMNYGHEKWGALPGLNYFVLELGGIIKSNAT